MDVKLFALLLGAVCSLGLISVCEGGYCQDTYACANTCYKTERYTRGCGWKGWKRCTSYRPVSYTCYSTCYNRYCCPGYRGADCTEPICDGANACLNGGQCLRPNMCSCRPGYRTPTCTEINECAEGTSGCNHACTNTPGGFTCSCKPGYQLSYDAKTCIDINECLSNNGGCEDTCVNTAGSYTCSCATGYSLLADGFRCQDVDECTLGTAGCGHECTNSIGSYTCTCNPGYQLAQDEHSCEDINECWQTNQCEQICVNLPATYECECETGFIHSASQYGLCIDVDECTISNGGCSHSCTNRMGSFTCTCPTGYTVDADGKTCVDANECTDKTSRCDQGCTNTHGSYICSCNHGFKLLNDDHSCQNIDDCARVDCRNGGQCVDGIASYTCDCLNGFKGDHCQTDIDECAFLNGGCQHNCTNTVGSFACDCVAPSYLHANGLHCIGTNDQQKLTNARLPVGEYLYTPSQASAHHVTFASTSKWYSLIADRDIVYTSGIVHTETDDLVLPVSMSGLELRTSGTLATIQSTVTSYTEADGVEDYVTRYVNNTINEITDSEIFTFIASNSFARSFFSGIQDALPDWLSFFNADNVFLPVTELSTDIVLGSSVQGNIYCKHAKVHSNRLYNVFVLSVEVAFKVHGDTATIALNSNQDKICIVTDIGQGGATVFVVFPEQSAFPLAFLSNLAATSVISIDRINGFGLSINKGIKVAKEEETLEVWNGDHVVEYEVFKNADVWLGGKVSLDNDDVDFKLTVAADLYMSVPNPLNLFTDTFEDKWDILFDSHDSDGEIKFVDFEINDFIVSVGGQAARQTCGRDGNPAGIFGSISPKVLFPFYQIPLLGDLLTEKLQLFLMTGDYNSGYTAGDVKSAITASLTNIEQHVDNLITELKQCINNIIAELLTYFTALKADVVALLDTVVQGGQGLLSSSMVEDVRSRIELLESDFNNFTSTIVSPSVCNLPTVWETTVDVITDEIASIKSQLTSVVQGSVNALSSSLKNADGFGLQYKGSLVLKITSELKLSFDFITLEFVQSKSSLGSCGRFHKVYELMKGEDAMRFYLEIDGGALMGYFFGINGGGIGLAINKDKDRFITQITVIFNPFTIGFEVTLDIFISNNGLYAYVEVTFFKIFYVQLEIAVELGSDDWYKLKLHLDGRFVSPKKKDIAPGHTGKRSVSEEHMSSSLIDMIQTLLNKLADFALKRIEEVQRLVTKAQSFLTKAQEWLEDKKEIVRKLEGAFDSAVDFLEDKKQALERAKGVFEAASDRLKRARDKVNRLCRIKSCRKICIPGIKCRWFKCRLTSCMWSIEDPFCVLRNIICAGIRAAAYVLYDVAIMLLQAPIIALDLAKGAIWVAQIAVDKASGVLKLAEVAFDVAQLGLEVAKAGLDVVNASLDAVKVIVKTGLDVLNFILEYGLKNIIDVRNCRFGLETESLIQPIFDVSCEIKPFNTQWITIALKINFLNPIQSLWHNAKAIVETILSTIGLIGRRKREISQQYMSYMHPLIRNTRSTNDTNISDILNATVSFMNDTSYGTAYNTTNEDFTQRVEIYSEKCQSFQTVLSFLQTALGHLAAVNEDFRILVNEMDAISQNMSAYNVDMIGNITLHDAGVNMTVANSEFNMTDTYVMDAYQAALTGLYNDSYVLDLFNLTAQAQVMMDEQRTELENFDFLTEWMVSMNETTALYFDTSDCLGLVDCMQYSVYTLNTLFISEDTMSDYADIIEAIDNLETEFLQLMNSTDADIYEIHNASIAMQSSVDVLESLCRFCDQPPAIEDELVNVTAVHGRSVSMSCNAVGDHLEYSWKVGGTEAANETRHQLHVTNLTNEHAAKYGFLCTATNFIASATSGPAYLTIVDECPAGTRELDGFCLECARGSYQPLPGQLECEACPWGSTTKSTGSLSQSRCVTTDPAANNGGMIAAIVVSAVVASLAVGAIAVFFYMKTVNGALQKVVPSDIVEPGQGQWRAQTPVFPFNDGLKADQVRNIKFNYQK